jgi:hypothetical protein
LLYLLHSGGEVEELELATDAHLDPETHELVCIDADGITIRRYAQLAITAFSRLPFPDGQLPPSPPL